jgi:hypothetical protein
LPRTTRPPGRLFALEGTRSADLRAGAQYLLRSLKAPRTRSGISLWDASSIFQELSTNTAAGDPPSAKTLMILYAADLAFRLRWEIGPALDDGYTVVAAPYTQTGIKVGQAAGLSSKWLSALFEFAPKPEAAYWLDTHRRGPPLTPRSSSGFPEFCFVQVHRLSAHFAPEKLLAMLQDRFEKDVTSNRLRRIRLPEASER